MALMCTPNRLHMQEKFKGSVKISERPQIPLWFLSYFLSLYLSLFKTSRFPQQPPHYNFQLHFFSPLSLSISFWGSLIQGWSIERGSGSEQETSVPVSFTKLGPSVSYSAFHLLPIRREITCTIFIALSKPFEVFLLRSLGSMQVAAKMFYEAMIHIFTYKIHT